MSTSLSISIWLYLSTFISNIYSLTFNINANNHSTPILIDEFLSFALGSIRDDNAHEFPVKSPAFNTLIQGLSPAFMRLGGTPADETVYSIDPSRGWS